jgi:hypothetical protein
VLDRLKQRIFADALRAAQYESVVDLLFGPLHAVRQPADDVRRILLAEQKPWRSIQIEGGDVRPLDPTAFHDQPIANKHR